MEDVLRVAAYCLPKEDFSELNGLVQDHLLSLDPKKRPSAIQLRHSYSSIIERHQERKSHLAVSQSMPIDSDLVTQNIGSIETANLNPEKGRVYTYTEAYELMGYIIDGSFGVVQRVRRLVDAKVLLESMLHVWILIHWPGFCA
jgi:hypothetical protein